MIYASNEEIKFSEIIYKLQSIIASNQKEIINYIVCPQYHTLYQPSNINNQNKITTCHKCFFYITKLERLGKDQFHYKLIKIFPYQSLIQKLAELLIQENFEKLLETCFFNNFSDNILSDIYDGKVWKEFQDTDGQKFFVKNTLEGRLGFGLNIDWFQPYKHCIYSVGAIYLTILNLPRELHYERKNTTLIKIIPGSNKLSTEEIMHYLKLLINEFLQF